MLRALTSKLAQNQHQNVLCREDDDNEDFYDAFSTPPTTPMSTISSISSASNASASPEEPHVSSRAVTDVLVDAVKTAPATTDKSSMDTIRPSLSRRGSRPSSLHIDKQQGSWTPDLQLVAASPDAGRRAGDHEHGQHERDETNGGERDDALTPQPPSIPLPTTLQATTTTSPMPMPPSTSSSASAPTPSGSTNASASITQQHHDYPSSSSSSATLPHSYRHSHSQQVPQSHSQHNAYAPGLKSPCFVHSLLEKGASLTDWLNQRHSMGIPSPLNPRSVSATSGPSMDAPSHMIQGQGKPGHPPHHFQAPQPAIPLPQTQYSPGSSPDSEDEDEHGSSLTRQLAETAVGVREMSKQLGRARVRSNIQSVLIITKARDNRLIKLTRELALYLMQKPRNGERGLVVYVDNQLRYSKRFDAAGIERDYPELFVPISRRRSGSSHNLPTMMNGYSNGSETPPEGQLRYWTSDMCSRSPHLFDFVVTLGGDGTVLFTSWLFQRIVPPVLPFALGSLGFLTNFDFADHKAVMDSAIDNGIRVNLRMRFTCTVYRAVAPEPGSGRRAVKKAQTGEIMMRNVEKGGWEALEGGWSESGLKEGKKGAKDKEIMCFTTRPVECFEVLNDLVVDRGPSPYVSLLELFGDEHHMTTVQADGLTVSTPTGSTAYSLSAGGSLVHPEIPALLITPICPHTLSFRPMLLPDSMELRICVPFNSRSTAWASFDGRGRVELKQGDHIKVTASKYPFPTVCADKQSTDWFHAISRTLKWNERERQKSFVVVEEGPAKPKASRKGSATSEQGEAIIAKPGNGVPGDSKRPDEGAIEEDEDDEEDEEDEEEDDEEEEKYDIDDSSAPEASAIPSSTDLVAMAKAKESERAKHDAVQARIAAHALAGRAEYEAHHQSHHASGIVTPDRFAGDHPHPPRVSPRHVSFSLGSGESESTSEETEQEKERRRSGVMPHFAEKGSRDHIHSPELLSGGRSRIPKDRDLDFDNANAKTPTAASHGHLPLTHSHSQNGHGHGSQGGYEDGGSGSKRGRESSLVPRAFAVWGQDESDSNASDSDT